jgi:hypothetical protein
MKGEYLFAGVILIAAILFHRWNGKRKQILAHSLNSGENPMTRQGHNYTYRPEASNWVGGYTTCGADVDAPFTTMGNTARAGKGRADFHNQIATDHNSVELYQACGISLNDIGITQAGLVYHVNDTPLYTYPSFFDGGGINCPLDGTTHTAINGETIH